MAQCFLGTKLTFGCVHRLQTLFKTLRPNSIKNHIDFLEAIILYRIREEDIGIDWEEKVCQRESGKLQGLLAQTDDVLEPRDIRQLTIR